MFTPSNPLFKAAYEGRIDDIRNYLSEGGGINALDKHNNTALHWAAKGNRYKVVKYLVENGIDSTMRNGQGDTALHWSVMSNNVCTDHISMSTFSFMSRLHSLNISSVNDWMSTLSTMMERLLFIWLSS